MIDMENGFIVLHRKLLDWEWADDPLTGWLWVRLLLMVNHKDKKWRGIVIKRGQVVTKYGELAKITGLSEWQVRTRLKTLEECGCLTKAATNKYSVITICNYDSYQYDGSATTTLKPQAKPHSNHKQTTSKTQCVSEGYEDLEKPSHTQNHTQTTTTKQIYSNISSSSYNACTCEENSSGDGSVLIESGLNEWKRSDIVKKGAVPELTDVWIEEVERLVLRFNKQDTTEETVRNFYEDFKAQEVTETLETSYHDWRKHFGNFVRKSIKQEQEEKQNGSNKQYVSLDREEQRKAAADKRKQEAAALVQKYINKAQQSQRAVQDAG